MTTIKTLPAVLLGALALAALTGFGSARAVTAPVMPGAMLA